MRDNIWRIHMYDITQSYIRDKTQAQSYIHMYCMYDCAWLLSRLWLSHVTQLNASHIASHERSPVTKYRIYMVCIYGFHIYDICYIYMIYALHVICSYVWHDSGTYHMCTNYKALFWEMTYEDKASYDSTPPCSTYHICHAFDMYICNAMYLICIYMIWGGFGW